MTTKQELEQLKKQIATLEAKIENEEKQEIKTWKDAWNKLKPEYSIQMNKMFTSEKEMKRNSALVELRLIAEAMNEGVDGGYEFSIYITKSFTLDFVYPDSDAFTIFPIFHTEELAQQALRNFKHLFEDLYAS
jgi:hypothetical protein